MPAPALLLTLAILGADPAPRDDGYRGIWYANQATKDAYRYKYSGGFATYPQPHVPIAIHAPQAGKTFFVYGGRPKGRNTVRAMISYYDHRTGTVPRPAVVEDKPTDDAHDNPTLSIDAAGHLWVFSNAHGTSRPARIFRSVAPYAIDAFETVATTNFSYSQPWFLPGHGFVVLHTRYSPGRNLFWMTSPDGREWSDPHPLARVELGHYQISKPRGSVLATAFNVHPRPVGLNARTNLYFAETADAGATWTAADGTPLRLPLTEMANPALVHDFRAEGQLVYLKDLVHDADGRPVILFLNSRGYEPGPANGPRRWQTARWDGARWLLRPVAESDHNYDFGSLAVEPDGSWTLVAPTDPGPEPFGAGGEVVLWKSPDRGETWNRVRALTTNSLLNHTYVRRPIDAHPDFAYLWADGGTRAPSDSALYFTDAAGSRVWKLPTQMTGATAAPQAVR
jgi:hypothetical protein